MTTYPNLDPELRAAAAGYPDLDVTDVIALRRLVAVSSASSHAALDYEGVEVQIVSAPGSGDSPPVPIRLLTPVGEHGPLPVLLAMHGGGFVLGTAQDFEYFCLDAVRDLGIAVANVEYRLAPEDPYPAPLDDCYAALRHVHGRAEELGLDSSRIAVGGSSAGGGLAAGVALRARDEREVEIAFQLLISPAVDNRQDTESSRRFAEGPILNHRFNTTVWQCYLGVASDGDAPAYAVPGRAADLSGLPPAFIAVMELDPIRDGNIQFALRLLQAGVSVELHSYPGTFHGSVEMAPQALSSIRAKQDMLGALRRGLRLGPSTT